MRDAHATSAQKLVVWLNNMAENPSISILAESRCLVLTLFMRKPAGMFINSCMALGIAAIRDASTRVRWNSRKYVGIRAT